MTRRRAALLRESAGVVKAEAAAELYQNGTPVRRRRRSHFREASSVENEYRTDQPSQGALGVLASSLKAPVDTARRFFFGELSTPGVLRQKGYCPEWKHKSSS
jgi:hypothetical protein